VSDSSAADINAEHEALIQFLYLAPVGLVQAAHDGTIGMINPISAQLLMPLSRDGGLSNLFTALDSAAPELRRLCAQFSPTQGVICDGMHINLTAVSKRAAATRVVSLSVVKLDENRLMAVLADVTAQVKRDRELKQTDAWLTAILTNISDYAMVRLDQLGRIDGWNDSIGRMLGYAPEALVGQPYGIFHPAGASTPADLAKRLRDADKNGWSLDEGARLRADGSHFWASAMISPLPDRDAAPDAPAYSLIIRDISDKRAAGEPQRPGPSPATGAPADQVTAPASAQPDSADAYEALIQFLYRTPIGLVQISADGTIEMLNPKSSSLLMPLTTDGNLGNLFAVLAGIAPELSAMASTFAAPTGVVCETLRVRLPPRAGAATEPQVLSISLLKLDAQRFMAVLEDATAEVHREQATLTRRLDNAARTDGLTKMPNRRAVQEQIRLIMTRPEAAAQGESAVMFINFDRFKQINDTLGNAAGDKVLTTMAERMRAALRPPTDRIAVAAGPSQMAARIGGDEFVVVLDGMRCTADIESVARRLLETISKPYRIVGQEIICNVSMGVVLGAQASGDADAVLRDASIAMAEAKRAGGGRYVLFDTEMRERVVRRGDIEGDLRRALQEQQLFVLYQPVVGLLDGGGTDYATGVEALVRWQHPTRGIVSPVEFIQVAEECGLIGAVGDFVLRQSCEDFVRWQAELGEGAPRLLAVNLSRAQLAQPGWTEVVSGILAATGMQAPRLQLEVTESLAAQDQQVQERLHQLKALGIKLALDDFGTGYSSLASLHLLPVDTVKIDRSFVSQGDTSHHHRVLIEATVMVARSLGMDTVAEGIETPEQAAVVRELKCDKGQGYLFSRPLSSGALLDWLGARAPQQTT
jgi:diguanylate cyclase (GGDEF)-like protein/PAS domain S-box-containing protein